MYSKAIGILFSLFFIVVISGCSNQDGTDAFSNKNKDILNLKVQSMYNEELLTMDDEDLREISRIINEAKTQLATEDEIMNSLTASYYMAFIFIDVDNKTTYTFSFSSSLLNVKKGEKDNEYFKTDSMEKVSEIYYKYVDK